MNLTRLESLMDRHSVDALVATSPENITYATRYLPFQGVWNRFAKAAIVLRGVARPQLILPIAEAGFVIGSEAAGHSDLALFGTSNLAMDDALKLDDEEQRIAILSGSANRSAAEAILRVLHDLFGRRARIAVDQTAAPEISLAMSASGSHEILPQGEDLWRLARMVKTPTEIGKLSRAIAVNEVGIAAVHLALGHASERELARIFSTHVAAVGGRVQHWVGNSGRRAGAYRSSGAAIGRAGERFRFDAGVEVDGYCSDLGGTAQIGAEPSRAERDIYAALTAGVDEGIAAARPGIRASALYQRVIQAIRQAGLPDHRFSLAGHGIGVEPRDYPILANPMMAPSPFWTTPFDPELEPGMVLNIECPLNALGSGGYQHEITLVVEQTGARLLSHRRDYQVIT